MELHVKESINATRLKIMIECDTFTQEERNQLKKYYKKMVKGEVLVTYNKRMDMGRRYADKSLSLQNFSKKIRHTLVHDTHTDIDIVNCHPILLSQYCDKNGIRTDCLNDYIQYRDTRLNEIITACDVSRKVAKEMVLVIMYLGLVNDYIVSNGITNPPPDFVYKLADEFKQIAELIKLKNESIYKKICASKNKDYKKNKTATTMSFVLQIIEDDLIIHARQKLSDMGFIVECLCFDGLLVQKQKIDEGILGSLTAYCLDKTGYNVSFEVKEMNEFIEIKQTEDFKLDDYAHPAEALEYYNQKYCVSLTSDNPYETYALRKNYIEKFLCKVLQPEPQYVFQNGIDRRCDFWTPTGASNAFTPVQSGFTGNMGGPISFYSHWSGDVNLRMYRRYDFEPDIQNCPPDVLNVFEGFNPDIYGDKVDNIEKCIKPYMDLVRELCGGKDDDALYLHRWFAQIFQDPGHKPPVAIIMKGKQGTGKNMLLDAIGHMLNSTHYISSSNPEDFFGTHSEGYYRKLLVNLNEAEGRKTFEYEGNMKSYISESKMTINPKNVRPSEVKNCARTIITTNKATPVPIDVRSKDRRYVVYQTSDVYLNKSSGYWTKLYNHLRKPNNMSALYQWFMSMDLKDYNWIKNRPLTDAYKEMTNLYSPVEAVFFEEMYLKQTWRDDPDGPLDDPNDKQSLSISALYSLYEAFSKKNRFMKEGATLSSSRAFISKLIELDFPIIRTRTPTERNITFIPQELLDHAKERRWLCGYEEELKEIDDTDKDDIEEDYFN